MIPVKKEYGNFSAKSFNEFILGCDVGGTNTNIGVFGVKKTPQLLFSFHFKSQQLKGLYEAVNYVLEYCKETYGIHITKACFGVAGPVSAKSDQVKITNLKWPLSKTKLSSKIKLKKILFINDFAAIGYSINILPRKDIISIKKGKKIPKMPIVVIGAGTGLGKSTVIYNEKLGFYTPLPSELGHSDFPAQSNEEMELADFIRKSKKAKNVTYEDLLSGNGLVSIYSFLKHKKFKSAKSLEKPELISKYRKTDMACKETFEIFKKVYARFARNSALDSLPFGGIYIAGGIAAKNSDIFDRKFIQEFLKDSYLKHLLNEIPIYLISNYNAGMIGSAFAAMKFIK